MNTIKLYREVKASERLPDKKWDGIIKTPADDMGIQYYHGTYYELADYDIWLEPIEITEEEIKLIVYERLDVSIPTRSGRTIWGATKIITEAILSKLKGDEKKHRL